VARLHGEAEVTRKPGGATDVAPRRASRGRRRAEAA